MESNNFTDMKDPAVLLYTADFIIGCTPMNWEERGKYIFLLCYQQQIGHMDLSTMEGIVGIPIPEKVMKKFKKDENGLYFNERMDEEITRRTKHKEKQSQNSLKRWGENSTLFPSDIPSDIPNSSQSDTKNIPLENEDENEIKNSIKKGTRKKKEFIPPTESEVKEYFKQNGYKETVGLKAWKYYTAMDWHDSEGKKIQSWKGKMIAVWFKEENEDHEVRRGVVDLGKLNHERSTYDGK